MAGVRERQHRLEAGEGTDRIAFFSDAVFAIALTLLVLDIRVPEDLADGELWPALVELSPQFLAYVITFAVLGINWISHHRKFRVIRRFDSGLIWLNLAFLMFVALAPFPTSVLAEYGDAPAVVLYAGEVAMLSILQACLWGYAARRRLLADDVDAGLVRYVLANILVTPAVFVLTIPVAVFVDPTVAMFSWVLLWPVGAVVGRIAARRIDRGESAPAVES